MTVILQAEVAILFIGADIVGMLYYRTLLHLSSSTGKMLAALPVAPIGSPVVTMSTLGKMLFFFLKACALTSGSGLVIVPFLKQGVVQQYGWLDEHAFLIEVPVGMVSPGPVVITATFVGYLVAGFAGALAATIGIFRPSFLLV